MYTTGTIKIFEMGTTSNKKASDDLPSSFQVNTWFGHVTSRDVGRRWRESYQYHTELRVPTLSREPAPSQDGYATDISFSPTKNHLPIYTVAPRYKIQNFRIWGFCSFLGPTAHPFWNFGAPGISSGSAWGSILLRLEEGISSALMWSN